ncbi:hypothetical protein LF1_18620 [Rubripirellula obstinata]|uniref:Uncharacterized protein n=1 Tax=Rubripirellula obstinata TaxID=406547 RepID=A0A5B1CIB9_9BACT|nr:hypothetical protein [Rubripirellula obstinata]KAA1259330.1 hypothetical protein LF1_18620 [Rubripirellula obstinata]
MTNAPTPGVSQTQGTTKQAHRQAATKAERDEIRYQIAKRWRAAGKRIWNAAEMESAIDRVVCRRRERESQTTSDPNLATQPAFFDAGSEAKQTRAAAVASSLNGSSTQRERCESLVNGRGDYGATRDEISELTGIAIQSVCGAVKAMLKSGCFHETSKRRRTQRGRYAVVIVAAFKGGRHG